MANPPILNLATLIANATASVFGDKGDVNLTRNLVKQYNAGKLTKDGVMHAAHSGYTVKDPLRKRAGLTIQGQIAPQVANIKSQQQNQLQQYGAATGQANADTQRQANNVNIIYQALQKQLTDAAAHQQQQFAGTTSGINSAYDTADKSLHTDFGQQAQGIQEELARLGIQAATPQAQSGIAQSAAEALQQSSVGRANALANEGTLASGLGAIANNMPGQAGMTGAARIGALQAANQKALQGLQTTYQGNQNILGNQSTALQNAVPGQVAALMAQIQDQLAKAQATATGLNIKQQGVNVQQQNANTKQQDSATNATYKNLLGQAAMGKLSVAQFNAQVNKQYKLGMLDVAQKNALTSAYKAHHPKGSGSSGDPIYFGTKGMSNFINSTNDPLTGNLIPQARSALLSAYNSDAVQASLGNPNTFLNNMLAAIGTPKTPQALANLKSIINFMYSIYKKNYGGTK